MYDLKMNYFISKKYDRTETANANAYANAYA